MASALDGETAYEMRPEGVVWTCRSWNGTSGRGCARAHQSSSDPQTQCRTPRSARPDAGTSAPPDAFSIRCETLAVNPCLGTISSGSHWQPDFRGRDLPDRTSVYVHASFLAHTVDRDLRGQPAKIVVTDERGDMVLQVPLSGAANLLPRARREIRRPGQRGPNSRQPPEGRGASARLGLPGLWRAASGPLNVRGQRGHITIAIEDDVDCVLDELSGSGIHRIDAGPGTDAKVSSTVAEGTSRTWRDQAAP